MEAGSKWAALPEGEHSPGLPDAPRSDLMSPVRTSKYVNSSALKGQH